MDKGCDLSNMVYHAQATQSIMTSSRHVANVIEREKQEVVEHLGWGMYGSSTLLVVHPRDSKLPSCILELTSLSTNASPD